MPTKRNRAEPSFLVFVGGRLTLAWPESDVLELLALVPSEARSGGLARLVDSGLYGDRPTELGVAEAVEQLQSICGLSSSLESTREQLLQALRATEPDVVVRREREDLIWDFYDGYEGEPEYRVAVDGVVRLRTWEAYLDALLHGYEYSPQGWTGLAKAHNELLWEDRDWQVPLDEAIDQLHEAVVTPENQAFETKADELRSALTTLLEEARENGQTVTIRRG